MSFLLRRLSLSSRARSNLQSCSRRCFLLVPPRLLTLSASHSMVPNGSRKFRNRCQHRGGGEADGRLAVLGDGSRSSYIGTVGTVGIVTRSRLDPMQSAALSRAANGSRVDEVLDRRQRLFFPPFQHHRQPGLGELVGVHVHQL